MVYYSMDKASRGRTFILAVIIVAVSFAVYFNALFNGFVYDDIPQVVENPWITDISHVPDMFSSPVWGFQEEFSANYYRPLMHVVFMLDFYLFGLVPWGFHMVNILFHCGVSVMVFLVSERLLVAGEKGRGAPPLVDSRYTIHGSRSVAFVAALLFTVHPVHTEAVTWVSGLPEVSFAFFCLLSFYLFVSSRSWSLLCPVRVLLFPGCPL